MRAYAIKKDRKYLDESEDYGPLKGATLFSTHKQAVMCLVKGEKVVAVEVKEIR